MMWVKRTGLVILSLPILLIIIMVLYEILGMCVNHMTTKRQTDRLQANLEKEIPDIEMKSIYSETGNTSGTGNHVECLSSIIFSTEMQEAEIKNRMSQYYEFKEDDCYIERTEEGYYLFYFIISAPFSNNIEGH